MQFESLTAREIWENLYGKELVTKKNLLEYIDLLRILKKENVSTDKVQENYNFVYEKIQEMCNRVKPNTIMYLQNQLKLVLGKLVYDKEPVKEENTFINFFKEAYPNGERRKDFTWVLLDIKNISNEQIWHTLTYINKEIIKNDLELDEVEIEDIIKVIELLVSRNDLKYINQVRSLNAVTEALNIKILSKKDKIKVVRKDI